MLVGDVFKDADVHTRGKSFCICRANNSLTGPDDYAINRARAGCRIGDSTADFGRNNRGRRPNGGTGIVSDIRAAEYARS
jgi:hypothetical protein